MKLIHLSDLHLGKRVNEFSMLEDQKYILAEIMRLIEGERPDAVIIAGDVYDKPFPPIEAVELFDDFLVRLSNGGFKVFIISGNHDSAERLAFGNRLIALSGIHIAPAYDGKVEPFELEDEYGKLNIYMLPFIKPVDVRRFYPEEEILSYTDALRVAIKNMRVDSSVRNILVTHQFVTGATRSDSEDISVGGADNVDASVFEDFDYVALGHLHRPQNVGSERLRYCGTPLKYSFSEVDHDKSLSVIELGEKASLNVRILPLIPLRGMSHIKGSYDELTLRTFYEGSSYTDDYMHITLTDEEDIPDAVARLRVIYRKLMKIDYDNRRTRGSAGISAASDAEDKSPLELFQELYEMQNASPMSEQQAAFAGNLIESIWSDEQ